MNPQQQKWYVLTHISTNGKYHSYDIRTIDFIGHCMQCEIVRTNKRRVYVNEVSIHRASPVWFVHWLAIYTGLASPVPIYAIWLYTGLDRTYYSFVFL